MSEWSTGYITYLQQNFPDFNWGIMPLPYFKTGITHTGAWAYSISKDTENLEEAQLLLRFLGNFIHIPVNEYMNPDL